MSSLGTISVNLQSNSAEFQAAQKAAQDAIAQTEATLAQSQAAINNIVNISREVLTSFIESGRSALENLSSSITENGAEAKSGFESYVAGAVEVSESILNGIETFDSFKNASNAAIQLIVSKAPSMGPAITAALGPIGLIAAAVAGLYVVVRTNFDLISDKLFEASNYFIRLYNRSTVLRVAIEILRKPFEDLIIVGQGLYEILKAAFSLDGAGIKQALIDMNTKLVQAQANALIRIKGTIDVPEIKKEDWDATAEKVRTFLRIPPKIVPPVAEEVKTVVDETIAKTQKTIDEATAPVVRAKIEVAAIGKAASTEAVAIIGKMGDKVGELERKYSLLNDLSGFLREKTNLVKQALEQLGSQGLDATNPLVKALIDQYTALTNEADKAVKAQTKALSGGSGGDSKIPGNGLVSKPGDNPLNGQIKDAAAIALKIEVPNIQETLKNIDLLNQKIAENQKVLADAGATNAARDAARANIAAIQGQIKAEKDKANVIKQVTREVFNSIRERVKAYLAEAIAGLLAKEVATKGLVGLAIGAAGAGLAVALFDTLVPKLAIGTDRVNSDGLAYLHRGEAVVPAADVASGGFTSAGNELQVNVKGEISGDKIIMVSQQATYLSSRLNG